MPRNDYSVERQKDRAVEKILSDRAKRTKEEKKLKEEVTIAANPENRGKNIPGTIEERVRRF